MFPELAENAEVLADGTIQLSYTVTSTILKNQGIEIDADKEKVAQSIDNRITELEAKKASAEGVKMMYDAFAKELLNPESMPERLEELLTLLMEREVKILQVMPNDNSRISDENSLLVMDMVLNLILTFH